MATTLTADYQELGVSAWYVIVSGVNSRTRCIGKLNSQSEELLGSYCNFKIQIECNTGSYYDNDSNKESWLGFSGEGNPIKKTGLKTGTVTTSWKDFSTFSDVFFQHDSTRVLTQQRLYSNNYVYGSGVWNNIGWSYFDIPAIETATIRVYMGGEYKKGNPYIYKSGAWKKGNGYVWNGSMWVKGK